VQDEREDRRDGVPRRIAVAVAVVIAVAALMATKRSV